VAILEAADRKIHDERDRLKRTEKIEASLDARLAERTGAGQALGCQQRWYRDTMMEAVRGAGKPDARRMNLEAVATIL
jgi:hypothetical protein